MTLKRMWSGIRKHPVVVSVSAGVGLVLILGGLYVFWSANAWTGYETSYRQWQDAIKESVVDAVKMPASNQKEREDKLVALQDTTDTINVLKSEACEMHGLMGWQVHVWSSAQAKESACRESTGVALRFGRELETVMQRLRNEHALMEIIMAGAKQKKIAEADFESQVTTWGGITEEVKELSVESGLDDLKSGLSERTEAVRLAWQRIYDAHKGKNRVNYEKARVQLSQAYAGLAAFAPRVTQMFSKSVAPLEEAYDELLGIK